MTLVLFIWLAGTLLWMISYHYYPKKSKIYNQYDQKGKRIRG